MADDNSDDGTLKRVVEARERARSGLVEQPTPGRSSRAGRDLRAATAVGLSLIAVVALSLAFRPEVFVLLAIVAVLIADWELSRAVGRRRIEIPLLPLWVGTVGMLVSAWVGGPSALVTALVLTAGTIFVWRVLDGGGLAAVRDAAAGIFIAAYVPFLAGFAVLIAALEDGPLLVGTFILLVIGNDLGGYIAGVLLGKHPMAPSISPKKSWEGFAGSVLLSAAIGGLTFGMVLGADWWAGVGLGILTVLTATTGDLSESLLKRDLGLKDLGALLPGHGGVMDRLDSLLVTAPVCYLVFSLALA
jgi:phosphatidate cytidylyltransferase